MTCRDQERLTMIHQPMKHDSIILFTKRGRDITVNTVAVARYHIGNEESSPTASWVIPRAPLWDPRPGKTVIWIEFDRPGEDFIRDLTNTKGLLREEVKKLTESVADPDGLLSNSGQTSVLNWNLRRHTPRIRRQPRFQGQRPTRRD